MPPFTRLVQVAYHLKENGVTGRLHLEHAEIVRPETMELMKGLDLVCHLQPCHWLGDHKWLKDKVGQELYSWRFPWRRMQQSEIEFDFGSDTPIEPPSVERARYRHCKSPQKTGIPKLAWKARDDTCRIPIVHGARTLIPFSKMALAKPSRILRRSLDLKSRLIGFIF